MRRYLINIKTQELSCMTRKARGGGGSLFSDERNRKEFKKKRLKLDIRIVNIQTAYITSNNVIQLDKSTVNWSSLSRSTFKSLETDG